MCTPPQGAEPVEQLSHALPGDPVKNTWSFDPDRQLDCLQDPTLENMLLRIEEMQVRATLQNPDPDNTVSPEKVTRDRACIYSQLQSCCV